MNGTGRLPLGSHDSGHWVAWTYGHWFRQVLIQALKGGGWPFEDVHDIGMTSKYSSHGVIISYKEENDVIMVKKHGTHQHE